MSDALDRLAEAYGIFLGYVSEDGAYRRVSDRAKRGVLAALGVAAETEDDVAASLSLAPSPTVSDMAAPAGARCFVPGWLENGRAWGISCQLYGLRSRQNWGIGDFEDLARLAEYAGACGADFLAVSPLHALFLADPGRRSPYSPSSRQFLNPLYIDVRNLGRAKVSDSQAIASAREADLVDYATVSALKCTALADLFSEFEQHDLARRSKKALVFEAFCRERGEPLELFARYEALAAVLVTEGHSCGWHGWPEAYRSPNSEAVRRFAHENSSSVLFHKWAQWVADVQLGKAQQRALAAGMRIGLHLDLAVGVAPDGADTWADPGAVVADARIGNPPDPNNAQGQDWELAPQSPRAMRERDCAPFTAVIGSLMRHAGAVRIDHAMGLTRLYWIPCGSSSHDGAYVQYPLPDLVRHLAATSQLRRTLVTGEDLGTVPQGFREIMRDADIQGYRVLYFERGSQGEFRAPETYTRKAVACISTHDLPTLRGWWQGNDISERERLGICDRQAARLQQQERERDRSLLLTALARAGLDPGPLDLARFDVSEAGDLPDPVLIAVHAFLARTPSRLVAAQLEDLLGVVAQANLPGTVDEHPNWRRKSPIRLEDLAETPSFGKVVQVLARERPSNG